MKKLFIFFVLFLSLFTFAHARVVTPQDCVDNPTECLIYDTGEDTSKLRQASGSATLSNGVWTANTNGDLMMYDWTDSSGGTSGVVTIELDARFEQCGSFTDSFYSLDDSDSTSNSFIWLRPGNTANKWSFRDTGGSYNDYGTCSSGVWYTLRFEQNLTSDTIDFYVDGVLTGNDVSPRYTQTELDRFGFQLGTTNYVEWANVTVYEGTNITRNSVTISTNLKAFYNETPVLIEVNTTETNFTYSFNGGSTTLVNSNSSVLTFNNPAQLVNNLTINNENFTFIFDNISPTINMGNVSEIHSYNVTWSDLFNYSDNYLIDSCVIIIGNSSQFCASPYTFTNNGNQTIEIQVLDDAGNLASEIFNLLVNPKALFGFYDDVRGIYVTNYTFGNYSPNNSFVEIPIYDLGLGSKSLEFIGFGFKTETFSFNFTNISLINSTFNVSPALLSVRVYDENNLSSLNNFDVEIRNSTEIKIFNSIDELTLYGDNSTTLLGDLEITISKEGYTNRIYSLTLDPYSVVNLNGYLLGSNDGAYIDFFIYDSNNKVVDGALISIYQSINGSDIIIEQVETDGAGYGGVFIDPTKPNQYFLVLKDGFVQQQFNIRATTNEYKVYLKTLSDVWEPWNAGISYSIEKHSLNTEPLNLTFTITNQNNDFTLWGFKVYDTSNNLLETIQSTTNSGGSLDFNDDGNYSKLKITYYYQVGSNLESFNKNYYYHFVNTNYSSLNLVDLGEDYVENEDIPDVGKALIFVVLLIFTMAIPNSLPKLEGKGAGLFLGCALTIGYSYVGGLHWGLTSIAIIGVALIHFDKKTEGRL